MGKNNNVLERYFRDKRRFADLFNGVCFGGRQVITADLLTEISESYVSGRKESFQRARDIIMRLQNGRTLNLLAVENQDSIDYTMPFRCMQYDVMEYHKQLDALRKKNEEEKKLKSGAEWLCKIRKEDRLTPVYTLCVYYGDELWDGPRSLKDMMDFGDDEDGMSDYFADYPMHMLCINEEQDFSMFHTELRNVFRAMQYRKDKKGLMNLLEKEEEYRHVDEETLETLAVLLDIPQIWEHRRKYRNEKESEGYEMCQAIREMQEDARNEGIEQGIEKGIERGIEQGSRALIETCQEMGLTREATMDKVIQKVGLAAAVAEEHLEKYWV